MVKRVRFVEYSNKSRKGLYVEIRDGKKVRQYKYIEGTPLDLYNDAYNNNKSAWELRKNAKKWKEDKTYREDYTKKFKGKLSTNIRKGSTKYKTDLQKLGNISEVQKAYKKLLGPLVLDKELLQLVIHNRHKLRHRFAYKLEINGAKKKLGEIDDIGHRTIEEMYQTYSTKLGYKPGRLLGQGKIQSDVAMLGMHKNNGRQYEYELIGKVIITIIFQKGV